MSAAPDALLPLLAARDLSQPFAWCDGVPVSGLTFLADAQRQAELLPASGTMINLCHDRYAFSVAFAAALLRGHTSLLPPDALPHTLERLRLDAPVRGSGSGARDDGASNIVYGATESNALEAPGLTLIPIDAARVSLDARSPAAPAAPMPLIRPDHVAAVLLTSGSTGNPSPHAKRFGTLVDNVRGAARRLSELLGQPSLAGLSIVATVPPQHSYGFESSVLLAMLGGAAIDGGRPYYPADIAASLARLPRPRALVTTPFHLKALLAAELDLPAVDFVLSATAPLSPQLAAAAERRLAAPLIEIYGCTEAGQVATRRTVMSDRWQAFDGLTLWEQPASGDEPACFLVQGGHVETATPLADVLELDDERPSSDALPDTSPTPSTHRVGEEGPRSFRLLGRNNDLIHVAGRRSSIAHLEHHLNSIDGVEDGAFWLPPDVADGVVRPVAFVVAPRLDAAHIIHELRRRLEPVFVPRRIVHVKALPREATGKLTRRALAELAVAQHPQGSPQ